jgi:toxin ParE1/3/4
MAEIIWSPTSLDDIEAIAEYISKDSFQAACSQVDLIFEKAAVLTAHPTIGKPVPELKDTHYREILVSRYRIIYKLVSDDEVYILTVHHQSRLLANNPTTKKIIQRRRKQ